MSVEREINEARAASYRAALAMTGNRRGMAELAETSAQLTVIRRLLGRLLPGGEAEFWRLVETELRK